MTENVKGKQVKVELIGQADVEKIIDGINRGKFFTAIFTKKDGTERTMNCRKQVKKDQVGGELKYSPEKHGLRSVYDVQIGQYRMVNVQTVSEIRANRKRYLVK
jgi:hypothetical protein